MRIYLIKWGRKIDIVTFSPYVLLGMRIMGKNFWYLSPNSTFSHVKIPDKQTLEILNMISTWQNNDT